MDEETTGKRSSKRWLLILIALLPVAILIGRNIVSGNTIGLQNAGNAQAGVFLVFGAQNNLIGGASAAAGNTIAHNGEHGVYVMGSNAISNTN